MLLTSILAVSRLHSLGIDIILIPSPLISQRVGSRLAHSA